MDFLEIAKARHSCRGYEAGREVEKGKCKVKSYGICYANDFNKWAKPTP